MAKNDVFLIDGIIEDRINSCFPSNDKGEVFEYLAAEQLLKDYDLSYEQITNCSVDGKDDGGIDYIFFLINDQLVDDPETFIYPKTNVEFTAYFITCKHGDSFKLAPVDSIYASMTELVDLNISSSELKGQYNEDILQKRQDFLTIYKKTAIATNSTLNIKMVYACRGDASEIADNICARSQQLQSFISKIFSDCKVEFSFFGSSEILCKYRKTKTYDIDLPIEKQLSKGNHLVVLTKLKDYYDFVTDEEGKLRRYLFDANVRDYMGLNRVNQDILETLNEKTSPDFWLLNNGVTMLVNEQHPLGESINLRNIQIVNGLQTTLTIYDFFSNGGVDEQNRCILIKIIKTEDPVIRDSVIKATNNQTDVSVSSLHATDKIQRDIEDILLKSGIYYERKTKYYENLGVDINEIITPLYLSACYVSLVLKLPYQAARLKQKFMSEPEKYNLVFSEKDDLHIWVKLALIYKKVDNFILSKKAKYSKTEKFKKNIRHPLAFFVIANKMGKYTYSIFDILKLDIDEIKESDMENVWTQIEKKLGGKGTIKDISSKSYFDELCNEFSDIKHLQVLKSIRNPFHKYVVYDIDDEFLEKVKSLLPEQPWQMGIHRIIAEKMDCAPGKVYQAIDKLIEKGKFFNQIDGVLYDSNGNEITG